MNLNIRQANATKSYVVTDVCTTRPRIAIKAGNNVSYLPLTTSAKQGFGLRNKVNGVNYRPLEYQSMSTSATYYTTAVASNGLSSTTALTRSSTSQTVYHTCSSTSGTSYLTRSSTSGTSYLTQSGTQTLITERYTTVRETSYYVNNSTGKIEALATISNVTYSALTYLNPNQTFETNRAPSPWYDGYYRVSGMFRLNSCTGTINQSMTNQYRNSSTSYTVSSNRLPSIVMFSRFWSDHYSGRAFSAVNQCIESFSQTLNMLTNMLFTLSSSWADYFSDSTQQQTYYVTATRNTVTTGTSYLTRSSTSATSYLTRSSTSRTEYKTRASTSGYSGVSSSSSQSSGWL